MLLPVFKPFIRRSDMDAVLSCLISDEIGPGNISVSLLNELGNYLGLKDGCLLRDYYRAISLVIDVLELKSGSRVILSPLAPGAYINVFSQKGIIPLFADVDPDTAIMNKAQVDHFLEGPVDALLLHCPLGSVADMDYFSSLGIPLIEDISENFGAKYNEKHCGSFGQVTLFSMEPDKVLTCGGGSALFVNNKNLAERLQEITAFYGNEIFLSDMNSSLALTQLSNIDENLNKREELARIFQASLNKTEYKSIRVADGGTMVNFSFPVFLNGQVKDITSYIMKNNIEPKKAFLRTALDIHENKDNICPVASGLILRALVFPLYPSLGRKNAELISKVISTLP
jgi:dTDP-4-amino-4,6-dideoxygalactose transaminase